VGRYALVDGGLDRPAALARIGDAAAEVVEPWIVGQGARGEVEQPGADHAAAPPELRNLREIEVVLVVLGVLEGRGLRVGRTVRGSRVRVVQHAEPLRVGGHHSVLDAVVDHLHEVAGAVGSAVQVALLRAAAALPAPRCGRRRIHARCQGREDRVEAAHGALLAPDHQAVAALEPAHAPAGADVDVVDAARLQRLRAPQIVVVARVATVDQHVVPRQQRLERRDRVVDEGDGEHDPDGARGVEGGNELLERRGPPGPFPGELLHGIPGHVVHRAVDALAQEAPHHVSAHASESDHSELHEVSQPAGRRRATRQGGGLFDVSSLKRARARRPGWDGETPFWDATPRRAARDSDG
jgi:hypothetical protein